MEFDPNKALGYARGLARPRLVGSGEDEKVAQEIAAKLESFGYQVEREPFQFTRAFEIALTAEIGVGLALVLTGIVLPGARLPVSALLAVLLIAVPLLNPLIHQNSVGPPGAEGLAISRGRVYRTANIVARPEQPLRADKPHIYLVAHYDSKSQRLSIAVRMVLAVLFVLSLVVFAGAAFLTPIVSDLLLRFLGLAVLGCGLPLLALNAGNESPGAIDNASGAGLVLHLAECLTARPQLLEQIQLTILITSAEEMAIMGSIYHVKHRAATFEKAAEAVDVYVLNFDGIGTNGRLYFGASADDPLAELAREAAKELRIPLGRFYIAGALFDHLPFAGAGLPAISLVTVGRDSWAVHTRHDTADKLHPRGFEMAGMVGLRVIERLAES